MHNTIRINSDAACVRVPIVPEIDATGESLDLCYAHLRSAAGSALEALERLRTRAPDVAFLDINLGIKTSETIARDLSRRGIPFAFTTGYGGAEIARAFPHAPVVRKPYEAPHIVAALDRLLGGD